MAAVPIPFGPEEVPFAKISRMRVTSVILLESSWLAVSSPVPI
jgi:hypothetical protein